MHRRQNEGEHDRGQAKSRTPRWRDRYQMLQEADGKGYDLERKVYSLCQLVTSKSKQQLARKTESRDQMCFAHSNATEISPLNSLAFLITKIGWKSRTSASPMAEARRRYSPHPHEVPYLNLERRKGRGRQSEQGSSIRSYCRKGRELRGTPGVSSRRQA